MKCRLGQVLKRVTAIGMAVWMIFLPLNVKISKVYGGQASTDINNIVHIEHDKYITVTIEKDGSEIIGIVSGSTEQPAIIYSNLKLGEVYDITCSCVSGIGESDKKNIEFVATTGVITDDKFKVTETMLSNDENDADISLKARLTTATAFQISGIDKVISASVGGTGLGTDSSGNYILKEGTYLTDTVDIMLKTSTSNKINGDNVEYTGVTTDDSMRNCKYSITVGDILLKNKIIQITIDSVNKYSVNVVNGTVTIPSYYQADSSNQYYEPLGAETFSIDIKPASGYKISKLVLGGFGADKGDIVLNENDIKTDNYEVIVSCGKKGDITATMGLIPIPEPNGNFTINNIYGARDAIITYSKPQNMKDNYVLQYAIAEVNNLPADLLTWSDCTPATGSQYTLTVPYKQNQLSKYIYIRYKLVGGIPTSKPQVSDEIKFDGYAPQITKVQLNLNGTSYTAKYNWGNADPLILPYYYFNNGEDIYMSGIDSNNEIRVYANDDQRKHQSGLQQQLTTGTGTLSADGSYYTIPFGIKDKADQMDITLSDQAGNSLSTQIKLDNILLDLTPPTAEVEFSRKGAEVDIEKWQIDAVTVKVTPDDQVPSENPNNEVASGVKSVKIFENGKSIGSMDSTTKVCTATVKDHGVHDLEIVVTDNAGNEFRQPRTIRIDKRGIINTVINFESENNNFYNDCIISAGAESLSGIQEIRFQFVEQGSVVREYIPASIDKGAANFLYTRDMGNFNGIVKVTFADYAGNTETIERPFAFNQDGASLTVSGDSDWTSGSVFVSAAASDPITKIKKIEYYVDGVLAEKVELEELEGQEEHTSYTGGITISDTAASHLGTQVEVVVTSASGKETHGYAVVRVDKQAPSISLSGITEGSVYNTTRSLEITTVENIWQAMQPVSVTAVRTIDGTSTHLDLGSFEADGATTLSAYSVSEDGVYQVTIQAVDAAGNSAVKTISFTIDRTAPVLSMSGVSAGAYSSTPVTVHFQSVESFFETNDVKINVERKLAGSTFGRAIDFSNTGKTSSVSNTFTEDGDYTITFSATDGAGNIAATQTLSFTVDCTAPSVTVRGATDYFVTKDAVKLDFSVTEAYYETNTVQIQGTRRTVEGKTLSLNISGWSNTGMTSGLSREFTEDGYYTITITATDKAGNSKSQTVHFTIDTTPPVIGDLSEYDGKYLAGFQIKERMKDLIVELSVPTVRMTLNGEPYDGSEITKDGKYTLMIQVEDEVGLTASRTIEFVIDTVAPKIIFAGAENNRIYTAAVNLNLSLENERDTILAIRINGKPYELTEGTAVYDLVFNEQGYYVIAVDTIDAAGNTNSQTIAFTYAEQKSIILLFVIVGAVVIAAGLVIGMAVKSKRKESGE